jgi:hypothetical protein
MVLVTESRQRYALLGYGEDDDSDVWTFELQPSERPTVLTTRIECTECKQEVPTPEHCAKCTPDADGSGSWRLSRATLRRWGLVGQGGQVDVAGHLGGGAAVGDPMATPGHAKVWPRRAAQRALHRDPFDAVPIPADPRLTRVVELAHLGDLGGGDAPLHDPAGCEDHQSDAAEDDRVPFVAHLVGTHHFRSSLVAKWISYVGMGSSTPNRPDLDPLP